MVPITDQFPLNKLVETYKTRQDVHDVFGLILYTRSDPYVIKVLRDGDFWNALDKDSGKRWPIFSIRPKQGKFSIPPEPIGTQFLVDISSAFHQSGPEWDEPFENQELLDQLQILDSSELPLFMIFAQGPNGEVLRVSFKITGESSDECFKCISSVVDVVAEAIKNVTEDNIKHTHEVFNLMEGVLNQHILFQRIQQGLSFAEWAKSVFGLLSK